MKNYIIFINNNTIIYSLNSDVYKCDIKNNTTTYFC